jgi:hypothetical protein
MGVESLCAREGRRVRKALVVVCAILQQHAGMLQIAVGAALSTRALEFCARPTCKNSANIARALAQ